MEFRGAKESAFGTKYGDTGYENTRLATRNVARAAPPDTEEIKKEEEEHYQSLRLSSNLNERKVVQVESTRKSIQWQDISNRMKYTVCIFSSILIAVNIGVIAVVVIVALPTTKDGGWSSWGSWGSCTGTCGGGVRLRSRSCTDPSPSLVGRPCTGDSSDVSFCNRQLCPDYNVTFTAYNLNTSGTSYAVLQFRDVYLNSGDAYNTTTGKFTCKIPGVYYFAVTLAKRYQDIGFLYAYLVINGSTKLTMRFDPDNDNSNEYVALPLTTSGTFHLNTNDIVYVSGRPNYFYGGYYSSFTGILLIPDQ